MDVCKETLLFSPGDRVRVKDEFKKKLVATFRSTGFGLGIDPDFIDLVHIVSRASTGKYDVETYLEDGGLPERCHLFPSYILEKLPPLGK